MMVIGTPVLANELRRSMNSDPVTVYLYLFIEDWIACWTWIAMFARFA